MYFYINNTRTRGRNYSLPDRIYIFTKTIPVKLKTGQLCTRNRKGRYFLNFFFLIDLTGTMTHNIEIWPGMNWFLKIGNGQQMPELIFLKQRCRIGINMDNTRKQIKKTQKTNWVEKRATSGTRTHTHTHQWGLAYMASTLTIRLWRHR